MPMIEALKKAADLERFTKHAPGALELTTVTLTDAEAWEFLEWYATTLDRDWRDQFDFDLFKAKQAADPWPMIRAGDFRLHGFAIGRATSTVQ
jgi:hypothetical protein